MDNETARMFFEALKTDIRDGRKDVHRLREEILALLREHRADIDESKAFRWRMAGAYAALVVMIELMIKIASQILK